MCLGLVWIFGHFVKALTATFTLLIREMSHHVTRFGLDFLSFCKISQGLLLHQMSQHVARFGLDFMVHVLIWLVGAPFHLNEAA
jgi:hypothetical protein